MVWYYLCSVSIFQVSALNRKSLFEPFVYLGSKLSPPTNKSTFSQLTIGRSKNNAGKD